MGWADYRQQLRGIYFPDGEYRARTFWSRFEIEQYNGCSLCPSSLTPPVFRRIADRGRLFKKAKSDHPKVMGWMPSFARWPLGAAIEAAFIVLDWMKGVRKAMRAIVLFLVICGLVVLPPVVYRLAGEEYTDLVGILFSFLLAGASVVFTFVLQNPRAEQKAREQWLPFAESAGLDLVTISSAAEQMRRVQVTKCGCLKELISDEDKERLRSLMALSDENCKNAAQNLSRLRDQLDGAKRNWEVFIRNHCEGDECDDIQKRIDLAELELNERMEKEQPLQTCTHQTDEASSTEVE